MVGLEDLDGLDGEAVEASRSRARSLLLGSWRVAARPRSTHFQAVLTLTPSWSAITRNEAPPARSSNARASRWAASTRGAFGLGMFAAQVFGPVRAGVRVGGRQGAGWHARHVEEQLAQSTLAWPRQKGLRAHEQRTSGTWGTRRSMEIGPSNA
jgi:hypothetical protein